MKVMMMILLFQILTISSLKSEPDVSAEYIQENVALRGRATQSALYTTSHLGAFCLPIHAIDGNRDSTFMHGSCSHTTGHYPWWRVDLLQPYTITSVTITNRADCCEKRITGARILIGNSLENNGINNPQCSEIGEMAPGETKTFPCPKPMTGRHVTVYLPKTEHLHLCEVEVNALLPAKESDDTSAASKTIHI